jgi:chromosome segregation protein
VLRKQADNAEKYRQFKQQERSLKAEILALRQRALAEQSQAHEAAIGDLEQALEAARARVAEVEQARLAADERRRAGQEALTAEQARVYEAEAAASRLDQELGHAREMRGLKQRELEQLDRQLAEIDRRRTQDATRLEQSARELLALEQQAESAQRAQVDARKDLARAEHDLQTEQQRWDEFQARSEQPLSETEGERVRIQGLERAQVQIDERYRRLAAESSGLDATPIQSSLFDADADIGRLDAEIAQAQERLQILDRDLQTLRDQRADLESRLHEARQQLQSAQGRLSSLETLQQAALHQDDAELGAWLRQNGLGDAQRLAQRVQVEAGWETAVEHVLEAWLQAPLTEGAGARALGTWPKAGMALIDPRTSADPNGSGGLASKVQGPSAVKAILSGVACAANEQEALEMQPRLVAGESVITPSGIWRGSDWVRTPGSDAARTGVIAREALLKQLRQQVSGLREEITAQEQQLGELRLRQQQAENERRELAARFEQSRSRQAQRMAFRQAQAVCLEQTQARIAALLRDIEALKHQREEQTAELAASREKLSGLETVAQQLREERNARQQSLVRARDMLVRVRTQAEQAAQAENQIQIRLAAQRSAREALHQSTVELEAGREALLHDRAQRAEEVGQLDTPLQARVTEVEQARAGVTEVREALKQARERLEGCEQGLAQAGQDLRQSEGAKELAQEHLQQGRIEFENLRARRDSLVQQLGEACQESGLDADAIVAGLTPEATAEAWDEKLASVGRRIDRLGAINLAAIQELEEAVGREHYLNEQHADLSGALDTLEEAIRKIDAETKERFKDTFDRVDAIFRDRFPKLFGGGEAYLELTGDDLLDTGVRVMARPPGKRNSSIQLLSGGEKAMTAVALLLGLFELNPAPFCLMDEVDAPLDDANVARYCEVVREMSERVQFIIITHNKITMELAAHLHGVTMQEPGVSRLVSVDVQQAVELAGKPEKETS